MVFVRVCVCKISYNELVWKGFSCFIMLRKIFNYLIIKLYILVRGLRGKIGRFNIMRMLVIFIVVCGFNVILIKILYDFFW